MTLKYVYFRSEIDLKIQFDYSRQYGIMAGKSNWKPLLHQQFPEEANAINRYFELVEDTKVFEPINGALKLIPLWMAWIVIHSGLIHWITNLWSGIFKKSTLDVIRELTKNKDLQTIFTYCWGDYGCSPKESHFVMQVNKQLKNLE